MRYLVRTAQYGLRYHGSSEAVYGYSDADFAGDISTRRSTAVVIMCSGAAITAASATEAECMAANAATRDMLWLRNLLYDLGMQPGSMQISSDSQGALGLMRNPVLSQQSKHINVLYHFVRDRIALGQVQFQLRQQQGHAGGPADQGARTQACRALLATLCTLQRTAGVNRCWTVVTGAARYLVESAKR